MAVMAVWLKIEDEHVVPALQEAGERLDSAEGEVVLDLSSLRRIDSQALKALEAFADIADDRDVKVALRGVNVEIYKVLKLARLARRFSFAI